MSLYTELRDTAIELLEELGEDVVITRPAAVYNSATLTASTTAALTQTLNGTAETPEPDAHLPESFTRTFARIVYCAVEPTAGSAFEPQVGDRVAVEGLTWVIGDGGVVIEKRQGVAMLYVLGVNAA